MSKLQPVRGTIRRALRVAVVPLGLVLVCCWMTSASMGDAPSAPPAGTEPSVNASPAADTTPATGRQLGGPRLGFGLLSLYPLPGTQAERVANPDLAGNRPARRSVRRHRSPVSGPRPDQYALVRHGPRGTLPSRRRYGRLPFLLGTSSPSLRKNNAIRPPPDAITCFGGACLPSERSSDLFSLRSPLPPPPAERTNPDPTLAFFFSASKPIPAKLKSKP